MAEPRTTPSTGATPAGDGDDGTTGRPVAARRIDPESVAVREDDDRSPAAVRERQRERFGGFHLIPALFGWLVALGISVLLAAILGATGAAIGLTDGGTDVSGGEAETIGIVGGVLLLLVFLIAYWSGGYAAGRMVRFDGARQGFGTWVFGILATIVLGVVGAIAGSKYNVFSNLDLPSIPLSGQSLTTGGAIAIAAILVGSLIAAVLGGKAGEGFHRRIDRAGV
jgi:hypothetical protein